MTDIILRTPEEFIEYYYTNMKSELAKYDIQINKLGMIGYLLNILGWTNYDLKQYYENLFKEAFVSTARDEFNLRLHSSIYGYNPSFAHYATASGSFIFDFGNLPQRSYDTVKREVIFKDISFTVDGYNFFTNAAYHFFEESDQYYCLIYTGNNIISVPSPTRQIKVPFYNTYQLSHQLIEVAIQDYDFGTHFPVSINLDKYLSSIEVRIGDIGEVYNPESDFNSFGSIYDVKPVKYLETPNSKSCFIKNNGDFEYILEFGSGIKALHVPDRNAVVSLFTTDGISGNINRQSTPQVSSSKYYFKLYKSTGTIVTGSISQSLLKIAFDYSDGGTDPLSGNDLRSSIINYIQTRDNFISEKDFYNISEKYMTDFEFIFRKDTFVDNTFYLERCFRDRYQDVAFATNHTQQMVKDEEPQEIQFIWDNDDINVIDRLGNFVLKIPEEADNVIREKRTNNLVLDNQGRFVYSIYTMPDEFGTSPVIYFSNGKATHGGILPNGEYMYHITASDNFHEIPIGRVVIIVLDGISTNACKLTWDAVPGATSYKIYGRPNSDGHYRMWTVYNDTYFIDSGYDDGTPYVNYTSTKNLVFYPEYYIMDRLFVSPFIYEYDDYMKWYKGYILYNNFMVYFNTMNNINDNEVIPLIFFNIVYDEVNYQTSIYIKSFQDISEYIIELSLRGTNITGFKVHEMIDETTWVYRYIDSKYSIIWDEITIEVDVFKDNMRIFSGQTNSFNQIYDISEQLRLLKYDNFDDNTTHLTNIPVIDKELFYSDQNYYHNKVHEFLYTNDFSENRMISDELQFRFLNSHAIEAYYTQFVTTQGYDFDLYFPLTLSVKAYVDEDLLLDDNIDLNSEKTIILDMLADVLQKKYTGTQIEYYNSKIVDYVHTDREYIKRVVVSAKDAKGTLLSDGLEIRNHNDILNSILTDAPKQKSYRKLKILAYTPVFVYWDVNNGLDFNFVK
jgi:hypothetical protein